MSEPEVNREVCNHILERVYQFHDHELTDQEAAEIRQHLMACEPCLDEFEVEQAMRLLIRRGCGSASAPESLRMKIRASYTHTTVTTTTTETD